MNLADRILVMDRGRIADIGPRAEIMGRVANNHRRLRVPINGGAVQDLTDWVHRQFVRDGDEVFRDRATTIATELFMFAKDNGPENEDRFLSFEFKFVDDTNCSITMSEACATEIETKIHRVRETVQMSVPDLNSLQNDERSLATVMQLAERFEHRSDEVFSAYFAEITQDHPNVERVA